jgi:hypothetical protein
MALKDIRGFMAKKRPPKVSDEEKIHVRVENWQWETTSPRFTWKHGLALALLIAVAILFALGFLIIAGVVLIVGIIFNIVLFIFKKLS